jgi:WD40 repeat protein
MCNAPEFWEEQYAARHAASSTAAAPKTPSVWPLERGNRQAFGEECLFVTGKTHKTLEGHKEAVRSIAFSPDGRTLATGSADGPAKLWDTATGALRSTLTGHTDLINSVAFSPDGRTLATASDDSTAKLWAI